MDFDSIISLVILFLFFVLPSLFKFLVGKKTKAPAKKKTSVFGKIGEQIQKFIKELEEQARQQEQEHKEKNAEEADMWQALAASERKVGRQDEKPAPEKASPLPSSVDFETTFETPGYEMPEQIDEILVKASAHEMRPKRGRQMVPEAERECYDRRPGGFQFRKNPLQNAMVWSEILSKPVALRDR